MTKVHPKVEEAVDTLGIEGVVRRRLLGGVGMVSASAAASALLAACSSNNKKDAGSAAEGGPGQFPATPKWKFVFVNHVTTNPFFTPTQYGAQDACALLGCSFQWTGSQDSVVPEMVNALNSAISAKADGIAVAVVDKTAFRAPVDKALAAGIPVVSYNADGARNDPGSNRLAYIGQDLYTSGYQLGQRIASLMQGGDAVGFIATPGSLNIQPRIDGAKDAIKASGKPINFTAVASGAELPKELSTIDAYAQGHKNVKGMFAVDAGSTENIGKVVAKYGLKAKGVAAGGFDLNPATLSAIQAGNLDFTIDQQPYLQGFLPVLSLWLYKLSGGLVAPSETNTGLLFVTKDNVGPYLATKTRYEGSSTKQELLNHSGAIVHK
jgi:simple sugar transport system substrate-binding protein